MAAARQVRSAEMLTPAVSASTAVSEHPPTQTPATHRPAQMKITIHGWNAIQPTREWAPGLFAHWDLRYKL